jgi:hypothetical protein
MTDFSLLFFGGKRNTRMAPNYPIRYQCDTVPGRGRGNNGTSIREKHVFTIKSEPSAWCGGSCL